MRTVLGALGRSMPRSTGRVLGSMHGTMRRPTGPVIQRSKDLWMFIRGAHQHAYDPKIKQVYSELRAKGQQGDTADLSKNEQRAAYHLAHAGTIKGEELQKVARGILEYGRDHGDHLARGLGTGSLREATHRYLSRMQPPAPSELPEVETHPQATTSIARTSWQRGDEDPNPETHERQLGSMSTGALRFGAQHSAPAPTATPTAIDPFGSLDE